MAYNKAFNTPLVVFTAFNGEMVSAVPLLTWVGRSAASMGLPSASTSKCVYSNGTTFIARGYANSTGNYAYYDPVTNTWVSSFTTKAEMLYWGNGVYLLVNGANVYSSFNGRKVNYAGYLPGLGNPVMCGASNGTYGVLSAWWVHSPMYAKNDVGIAGNWALTGDYYEDGMCCFTTMTCHKGMYVGVASDTISGSGKGGIQISSNGYKWKRTITYPLGHANDYSKGFGEIRSINGRLFLKSTYITVRGGTTVYQLSVMNNNASSYTVVRQTTDSGTIPPLSAMVYVEKLGQYLHFGKDVIYASPDGFRWMSVPQKNFGDTKSYAVYIPGDGFYVSTNGSWGSNSILYGAYP
ncbi:MAG: hypothetical protein PHI41_04630 [Erysipelotrichaceae bacterium]|nr:hypothetical protein [Erysipelotrichaceae bacterium]